MIIEKAINQLLNYGLKTGLIKHADISYVANQLIDVFGLADFTYEKNSTALPELTTILADLIGCAREKGIFPNDTIDEWDLFDTKIMGYLMPRPSEINYVFTTLCHDSPQRATDYFYHLSQVANYIRVDRVKKDRQFQVETAYGKLDITINLSKPEKDPKTIAAAKQMVDRSYPKCLLCKENVGYAGHLAHPARQNHRIIPVTLATEEWYFQYSPYLYYNEHAIIFKGAHEPMVINQMTFARLFDFVRQFKHYFVGANADLPIVGGSILSHDHFQSGAYTFPMTNAEVLATFEIEAYPEITAQLLKWPLTTLRLKGHEIQDLTVLADFILQKWRNYSDKKRGIFAQTDGTPHNTITPIVRYRDDMYEIDLVLRNNRTSDVHPDGIFHPHSQYHHLKKENIGLIEVMGLAVLPGRLLTEIETVKEALIKADPTILTSVQLERHVPWYHELVKSSASLDQTAIEQIIQTSIGIKFAEILACCGVFKLDDDGFAGVCEFMKSVNHNA